MPLKGEAKKAWQRKYYERKRDEKIAYALQWQKNNPEKFARIRKDYKERLKNKKYLFANELLNMLENKPKLAKLKLKEEKARENQPIQINNRLA